MMLVNSFWSAAAPPAIGAYVATAVNTANQNSYTFSGVSIGVADASRLVVLAIQYRLGATDRSVITCTIDGNAMTAVAASHAANSGGVALYCLAYPTGTTAEFIITVSGGGVANAMQIATYRVLPVSGTAVDSGSASGSNTANATDIEVKSGGFLVCVGLRQNTGGLTASYNGTDTPVADLSNDIEAGSSSLCWSANTAENNTTRDPGATVTTSTGTVTVSAASWL